MPKTVFSEWEKTAWLPPVDEPIDVWAEREVVLPRSVSSITGPLSLDLSPYLRGPLREITAPQVERASICTSTQVGKTTFLILVLLYYLKVDPWNCLFVMPSEDQALEAKHERFLPVIRESPALKDLITGAKSEFAGDTIRLNGATITFRGSHSPSALASKPAKIAVADEVDKWDDWTGAEASPVDLLSERLKTFHDSKFILSSTPTTPYGYIWRELLAGSNERYWVPCPHCSLYQVLVFGDGQDGAAGIKWPSGIRDPDLVALEGLAWYECAHCHGRIDEREKRTMLARGIWAPIDAEINREGDIRSKVKDWTRRSYHLWAGYSLWPKASWSNIAAMFLRAKGAESSLMNFRNSWLAEPWELTMHELRESRVRGCVEGYKQGATPTPSWVLVAGVDVQKHAGQTYHYYVLRAWGPEGKSHLVRCGVTQGWEALYSVLFQSQYRSSEGAELPIGIVVIDSGFATDEVYSFCDTYGLWAAKGDVRMREPYKISQVESPPRSGNFVRRVNVNSDFYKSQLHRTIREGKFGLPEDTPDDYFHHMTAEQLISETDKRTGKTRVRWKLLAAGRPNHYFDAEVYAILGAEMLELRYRNAPPPKEEARAEIPLEIHSNVNRIFS